MTTVNLIAELRARQRCEERRLRRLLRLLRRIDVSRPTFRIRQCYLMRQVDISNADLRRMLRLLNMLAD
eukprot:NODE_7732_length_424_cov_1.539295.p2 GENE.NODE_7732_length_424_cov_1.539295~~NODE_7732_length_424_cov_1.539295.p2  ORF type:complete len:69 (-),score=23.75 NODE_7732_length_424_cov_1.539295:45-251(-)